MKPIKHITGVLQAISVREQGIKINGRWHNLSHYATVRLESLRPYIGQQVVLTVTASWKPGKYWVRHIEPLSASDHALVSTPAPTAPLSASQSLNGQAPVSASHNGTAQAQTPTPTPTPSPEPKPKPNPKPNPNPNPNPKGIERIDAIMARIMEAGNRRSL